MATMTQTGPAGASALKPVVITERDLVFYCLHCQGELVVDREGVGLEVNCPHCKRVIVIPEEKATPAPVASVEASAPAAPPAEVAAPLPQFDFTGYSAEQISLRLSELGHQLKENQSQDMEMRGHINRATIELHRLQLKLKKLQDRKTLIDAEQAALKKAVP